MASSLSRNTAYIFAEKTTYATHEIPAWHDEFHTTYKRSEWPTRIHKVKRSPTTLGSWLMDLAGSAADADTKTATNAFVRAEFQYDYPRIHQYVLYKYTFGSTTTARGGLRWCPGKRMRSSPVALCGPSSREEMLKVLDEHLTIDSSVELEIQCQARIREGEWNPRPCTPKPIDGEERFGSRFGSTRDCVPSMFLLPSWERLKDLPDSTLRFAVTQDPKQAWAWAIWPWPSHLATGNLIEDEEGSITITEVQEKLGLTSLVITDSKATPSD